MHVVKHAHLDHVRHRQSRGLLHRRTTDRLRARHRRALLRNLCPTSSYAAGTAALLSQ